MLPRSVRIRAAVEQRMSAVAVGYLTSDTFAERLDRAIARSGKAPKLIEARAERVDDR